jgi:hypothetical protein
MTRGALPGSNRGRDLHLSFTCSAADPKSAPLLQRPIETLSRSQTCHLGRWQRDEDHPGIRDNLGFVRLGFASFYETPPRTDPLTGKGSQGHEGQISFLASSAR